jgi:glycosyltransferase involved in cell wall biosynthesis
MKVSIICYQFPPQINGIGDYTFYLAEELVKKDNCQVKIWTDLSPHIETYDRLKVIDAFTASQPFRLLSLVKEIGKDSPDWVVFQYDPFGYGFKFGINPLIPIMLKTLNLFFPKIKVAIIIHESFIPINNLKSLCLSKYLNAQLWLSCQNADALISVINPWLDTLQNWFPTKVIQHIPVGSNIPCSNHERQQIRSLLKIDEDCCVLGLFGRVPRKSIEIQHIVKSIKLLQAKGIKPVLVYLGLDKSFAELEFRDVPSIILDVSSAIEISKHLHAIDVFLVPTNEGLSTRKTSFMAGIQHGLPTVSIEGISTDEILRAENRRGLMLVESNNSDAFALAVLELAENSSFRTSIADAGRALYSREFTWEKIAQKLLDTLSSV